MYPALYIGLNGLILKVKSDLLPTTEEDPATVTDLKLLAVVIVIINPEET
jgi:hypothetical protein